MATTHYKTKIVLYKGVPFGIDYNHTLEPSSLADKVEFLNLYDHNEYNDLQTIHMDSVTDAGIMRLSVFAKDAYEYNYAYIEDPQHGLKFCAFITGCRYINDSNTSPNAAASSYKCVFEFVFVKDLLMTYLEGSNNLSAAPIIRHTATRRYNSGFYGEGLSFPLVTYDIQSCNRKLGYEAPETDTYTVLWCSFNWPDPASAPDSTLNGLLNCVLGLVYKSTDSVKQDLVTLAKQQGFQLLGVTAMPNFMYNWDVAPSPSSISGKLLTDLYVNDNHSFTISSKAYYKTLVQTKAGFTPRNKKCFYYPFSKFALESNAGSVVDLAPEYLNTYADTSADINFIVRCSAGRPCNYTVFPFYYGAIEGKSSKNLKCTTSAFPEGCATLDSYAMYLANRYKFPNSFLGMAAQHVVEAVPSLIGKAGSMFGGGMSGAEITATNSAGKTVGTGTYDYSGSAQAAQGSLAGSFIGGTASGMAQGMLAADAMSRKSDVVCGAVASPETDFIRNNIDVQVMFCSLHPDTLRGLDEYFEKFGYAQGGELRTPDLSGRDRYVYCQTGGDVFTSKKCNAAETAKINALFMNGVTCWRRNLFLPSTGLSYGDNGDDPIDDAM